MKMFRKNSGKPSKKELFSRAKSGDPARGNSDLGRSTPLEYQNQHSDLIKRYEEETPDQADFDALRAFEMQKQEDEEKRRVIEELAKERSPAIPTATVSSVEPKAYPDKRKTNAGLQFIKALTPNPGHRQAVAEIVRGHRNGSLLPKEELVSYINDSGYAVADLSALGEAAEYAKCEELLTWSSRYNLFVLWSADKQHPWDVLADSSDSVSATLEIGKELDGSQAVILLDGVRIHDWTFKNGRFSTTQPIKWKTPSGEEVEVELFLNFNIFTGYGGANSSSLQYFGPQCQGVIWPASQRYPVDWPVSPPFVVGKVNITSRLPALSSGNSDVVTEYCGVYRTYFLNTEEDSRSPAGPELDITYSESTDAMVVALDGVPLRHWSWMPNNTLVWDDANHGSGCITLQKLHGGPVLFGDIKNGASSDTIPNSAGYAVFGELKSQPSRLTATGKMNPGLAYKVAAGLQTMAAILIGDILQLTNKMSNDNSSSPNASINSELQRKLDHLESVEKIASSMSGTYLKPSSDGTLDLVTEISPEVVPEVYEAFQAARQESEVAAAKAQAARKDCMATKEAELSSNVSGATYHAAQTSLRAQEAAKACAAAEKASEHALTLALKANTALALDSALTAAQAFNLAHASCLEAAKEEATASAAALRCVSSNIEQFVKLQNFEKLRDVAQASNIATKVLAMATEAVNGWEANTVVSRLAALQASNRAAADAQETNKITRRMSPATAGPGQSGMLNELVPNQSVEASTLSPFLPSTPPRSEHKSATAYSSPASDNTTSMSYE